MKKYSVVISLLLTHFAFSQNGTITNGGFENWSNQDLYEYPVNWNTSDHIQFISSPTVTKSTDAQDGTFSCQIGVVEIDDDTLFGGVFHGDITNFYNAGIPYSDTFNEVRFQYKSDIPAGDTLVLFIIRFENGSSSAEIKEAVVGTNSNWTAGSVTVSNATQDSLFIGFLMNNPFGNNLPNPTAWARIDALEMYNNGTAVTNIPNPSFENWSTQTTENPNEWYSFNQFISGHGNENAIKTTDANTGSYAIELSTIIDLVFEDTIPAVISIAPIGFFGANTFTLLSYNASPSIFSGAYKYAASNGDQGFIEIEFFQSGNSIGSHTELFNDATTWQTFSSPLTISGQPDSLLLIAFSGNNPGSVLKLDDLVFSGGNVSLSEFETMNVSMFPNPAKSSMMIMAEGMYSIKIVDLMGHVVKFKNHANEVIELDISDLNSGTYFVKINSHESSTETLKLIVE